MTNSLKSKLINFVAVPLIGLAALATSGCAPDGRCLLLENPDKPSEIVSAKTNTLTNLHQNQYGSWIAVYTDKQKKFDERVVNGHVYLDLPTNATPILVINKKEDQTYVCDVHVPSNSKPRISQNPNYKLEMMISGAQ